MSAVSLVRASIVRACAVLSALFVAKATLVGLRVLDRHGAALRSMWTPFVFTYQDVWLALVVLALDVTLVVLVDRGGLRWPRVASALRIIFYVALAGWAAINVPVARVFGTPLTWTMLGAAGGALKDSILPYFSRSNLLGVLVVVAAAAVLPFQLSKLRTMRVPIVLGVFSGLALVLGPPGTRRLECFGLHRNATVTVVRSLWQRRAHLDGIDGVDGSPKGAPIVPSGRALDLSHLGGAARGKNVVWVILESTGARYLKPYGADVDPMPNLTRLAEHAVIFDNAYAVHPESIKGLYSMLCSVAPAPHVEVEAYAADKLPCTSIAARFAEAGYQTGFFHSGRFAYLGMTSVVENRGFARLDDAGKIGGKFESSFGVDDASTARRTLAFIDERKAGDKFEKFFAVYSNISGHHPYTTPGEGARPFGEDDDYHRYLSDLFRGDLALGILIEGLRTRGLLEDTLWVIHGDHGEAFFQHEGNFAHTLFVYEENVHVPLIIVVPGALERPVHAPQIASLVDLAPTMADLASLKASPEWQGGSLLAPTPRVARFFVDQAVWQDGLRDGDWKFITEIDSGRSRLFDVANDPDERVDVSASDPERVERYRAHLLAWQARARELVGR